MLRFHFTSLASLALLTPLVVLMNAGSAFADPYAGYSQQRHGVQIDRTARTVSRGAVVVERDRNRVIAQRAAAHRSESLSSRRVANNPQSLNQGDPSATTGSFAEVRERARADSPRIGFYRYYHRQYFAPSARAYVHHYPHPRISHRTRIATSHKLRPYRPARTLRLHTGFSIGYHGKHVGIRYHHGWRKLRPQPIRCFGHLRSHSSGLRIHLRF